MNKINNSSTKTHFKTVQSVLWRDIRKDFRKVNAELARIIDNIDPGEKLPLIKVSYAFGEKILKNGQLCLVDDFKNNPTLAKTLKLPNIIDDLSYTSAPLGVFLNKYCEAFVTIQERIIPIFVQRAGCTIGKFETLDLICGIGSSQIWDVTAGARSIFMLSKINNSLWHKRLERNFNITAPTPTNLKDHWRVFTAIANSKEANTDWSCDVIFFPRCWIKHFNDKSAAWSQLRDYLFRQCWLLASPVLEKSFSFMWQQFSLSTMRRNHKPRIYITDTIRHLMEIVSGTVPAFVPARNEDGAPIELIKTAYSDIYNLPHAPTLMEPAFINDGASFVYYSLGYPTLLEGHTETNNIYNTISDLKEVKLLIENMHRYYQDHQKETYAAKAFAATLQKVDLDYFHKVQDERDKIYEAGKLTTVDKNFLETSKAFATKEFCTASPFFNGCIQIKNAFLG